MNIFNYSDYSIKQIKALLPKSFKYDKMIVFPDICYSSWLLPTGIAVLTNDSDWRKYAISDIGCGMLLCRSKIKKDNFDKNTWNDLCVKLQQTENIGDFTKGNHFLNAMFSQTDGCIYFLVHCGVDSDINDVALHTKNNITFEKLYFERIEAAKTARMRIFEILSTYFGDLSLILDKNHNQFEITEQGIVIRRGAVKIMPGESSIVPSHMLGKVALVRATNNVEPCLFSICHGTGRLIERLEYNECNNIKYEDMRKIFDDIYIPSSLNLEKLVYDTPNNYRELEDCLSQIDTLVTIDDLFVNIAYIGKL